MNQNTTIRNATIDDLPAIIEIYNSSIPSRLATADTEPVSVESKIKWFHQHNPKHRPLWILEKGNKIIAWISLSDFKDRPAYQKTVEISLYVSPEFQGKGFGKKLIKKMIDKCPDFGVENLIGLVFGHNRKSIKLAEKFGFEEWGFLPEVTEMDGIKRDVVILGLKIEKDSRICTDKKNNCFI